MGDSQETHPATHDSGARGVSHALAPVLISILLVLAVVATFRPALSAEFLEWDDQIAVTDNAHIRGLTAANVWWALTRCHMGHYHPLTWVSYMVEFRMWGLNSIAFHAGNIALHAVNTVLVYLLGLRIWRLGGASSRPELAVHLGAAMGAAFWGLHPLRVESVAWVTQRRDVLSTPFLALACLVYLSSASPGEPRLRSRWWSTACAGLLVLSVLSKAWGMTFFVIALMLDVWPLRRLGPSPRDGFSLKGVRLLLQKWPLIIIGIATAIAAAWAQHQVHATKSLAEWSVGNRLVQSAYGLWFYVKKTLWPTDLSPLIELPDSLSPSEPRFIVAYVFLAGAAILVALRHRRWPWLVACAGAYLVLLAPVLGLSQSGIQFVADRYSYLACIGLSLLLGAGAGGVAVRGGAVIGRAWPVAVWTIAAGVIVWLAALAYSQTTVWRDSMTLWEHALRISPSPEGRVHYAHMLLRTKRDKEAREQLTAALASRPRSGMAWLRLAELERREGHDREAERAYLESIACSKPAVTPRIQLGFFYERTGRKEEAAALFRAALDELRTCEQSIETGRDLLTVAVSLRKVGDTTLSKAALDEAARYPELREDVEAERRWLSGPRSP